MTAPSHAPIGRTTEPSVQAAHAAPALEAAVDRAGVLPGWWVTGVANGSPVAHRLRLQTDAGGARSRDRMPTTAVCGRRVMRPVDAAEQRDTRSCGDCVTKTARALPRAPLEPRVPPAASAPRVRASSGITGELPNTAAARTARRRVFRESVLLPDGARDYVPTDYGAGHSSAVVVRAPQT